MPPLSDLLLYFSFVLFVVAVFPQPKQLCLIGAGLACLVGSFIFQ